MSTGAAEVISLLAAGVAACVVLAGLMTVTTRDVPRTWRDTVRLGGFTALALSLGALSSLLPLLPDLLKDVYASEPSASSSIVGWLVGPFLAGGCLAYVRPDRAVGSALLATLGLLCGILVAHVIAIWRGSPDNIWPIAIVVVFALQAPFIWIGVPVGILVARWHRRP